MKKNYIILLSIVFFGTISFGAKQPIKKANFSKRKLTSHISPTYKSNNADSTIILVSEDFGKFTLGNETTPDTLDITDPITGVIPSTYTQSEGWSGWGVQQAGGVGYMGWVNYSLYMDAADGPGYIVTPLFDASAANSGYTIKFKARSKSTLGDSLYVYNNYNDSLYDEHLVIITNQWAEYTITQATGDANSYVDIYGTAAEFYLDDLQISYFGSAPNPGGTTNDVFLETFGSAGGKVKIPDYTDYDNSTPIVFSSTTTDKPDVRTTSTMDAHVWFPAAKETDLVISNIPAAGYSDLKLSFDVAANSTSAAANINKVIVEVNDLAIIVPSVSFTGQNVYSNSGDISIASDDVLKLRFYYTAANNPTNFGYRLDNIKITGVKSTGVNTPNFQKLNVWINNDKISFEASNGEKVEVFNTLGQKILSHTATEGKNELSVNNKGVTIVKVGNRVGKVIL